MGVASSVAAVLDFRTIGIGDPAVETAALLHVIGESLVAPHRHEHGDLDEAALKKPSIAASCSSNCT